MLFQHLNAEQVNLQLSEADLQGLIAPDHLQQIMDNLCTNAFKHNQAPVPHLTLTTEQTAQGICINVIDNGIAISPESIEHLFEPFFTTSATGTGLGLYISRELAELNHAKLSYYRSRHSAMDRQGGGNDFAHALDSGQLNNFRLCLSVVEQPKLDL